MKKINRALVSVYSKEGILEIAKELKENGVELVSTGGTADFLQKNGFEVTTVETLTAYPSILGGRVKTLHPAIFGGILSRRENPQDQKECQTYNIAPVDLVITDLYPFEDYVAKKAEHQEIIEKIDIGGISLIRAAAKNYADVVIVPSKNLYPIFLQILKEQGACTNLSQREYFATMAFSVSAAYDSAIFSYFNQKAKLPVFTQCITQSTSLRYGENPHQKGSYFGSRNSLPTQLHGKEISYNNLLDIEAAIELINDFTEPTVAVIKHTNACGCASADNILSAWKRAYEGDPVSIFGGIIIANRTIDKTTAEEIDKIFIEVIIAPAYEEDALKVLKNKKNRIILLSNGITPSGTRFRSLLHGVLVQERDTYVETPQDLKTVTTTAPAQQQIEDMLFANKLVKHSKSNAIVLAKNKMLLASGVGQTSRVDALKHAIEKAQGFNLDLKGAVMASDAFFPFKDCVELTAAQGITAVIQPGGSIRDQESIDFCNKNAISMVMTGIRHFKH